MDPQPEPAKRCPTCGGPHEHPDTGIGGDCDRYFLGNARRRTQENIARQAAQESADRLARIKYVHHPWISGCTAHGAEQVKDCDVQFLLGMIERLRDALAATETSYYYTPFQLAAIAAQTKLAEVENYSQVLARAERAEAALMSVERDALPLARLREWATQRANVSTAINRGYDQARVDVLAILAAAVGTGEPE